MVYACLVLVGWDNLEVERKRDMVRETSNSEENYPNQCHSNAHSVVVVYQLWLGLEPVSRVRGGQTSLALYR
jgi:hypothetical protein